MEHSVFDSPPDRRNSHSIKWDRNQSKFGRDDIIPLWIADMDFAIAESITRALEQRLAHPVFGYSFRTKEYTDSILNWLSQRYQWDITKRELLFYPPGTVAAINCLVNLFSQEDDEIIVHTPAYPPLTNIVEQNNRRLVRSPLVKVADQFEINWQQFEASFSAKTKILILCSPHNPTGRVWTEEELSRMARICRQHNVMVISDEVHADLTFPQVSHLHFNRLPAAQRPPSVTIISSCKSFNLAGLSQATLICDDKTLRQKIQWAINTAQLNLDNVMSATAMQAGYQYGDTWLDNLRHYIQGNRVFLADFLQKKLNRVSLAKAQGTYLAWLDFSELGIEHERLAKIFVEEAGVGLYDGKLFGEEGTGYFRINLACSRTLLKKALIQLSDALKKHL